MSDPYLGEIKIFASTFAPRGWAKCDGQLLPIAQNSALFSILGTQYGGDGRVSFALPDLRDRAPVGAGSGPGLDPRIVGEPSGTPTWTLLASEMPPHTHAPMASSAVGTSSSPAGATWGKAGVGRVLEPLYAPAATVTMAADAVGSTGGGQPMSTLPPYLGLTFIIALQGIYPSRP